MRIERRFQENSMCSEASVRKAMPPRRPIPVVSIFTSRPIQEEIETRTPKRKHVGQVEVAHKDDETPWIPC